MRCLRLGLLALLMPAVCIGMPEPRIALELPPGAGNPRNSEGDFAVLKDGSILFVYTHYTQGAGGDHDPAHLCSRISRDGGNSWSANDELVVENDGGMNVMSVSLLRLKDGALAIFYLLKNSEADCRPVMRVSRDEGRTWSAAVKCVPDSETNYYVLNNCRATRLACGRIVLPMCIHSPKHGNVEADWYGTLVCWFSDDDGQTWRRGSAPFATFDAAGNRVTTQEPGVIPLTDGRVLMYARTDHGRQWFYYSSDGCETWSAGRPSPLMAPCGPATLKRLSNGDILAVWNDLSDHPELAGRDGKWGTRVPMSSAISRDDGRTWIHRRTVDGRTGDWYCYFAVMEHKGNVLCGYCAKDGLKHSRITSVPISWLYGEDRKPKPSCFIRIKEGAFFGLSTEQGTWSAQSGSAEICSWARGKGVKILGGENRTVYLQLPIGTRLGDLGFFVERFSSAGAYNFKIEGQTADGTWHGLFAQGADTGVGRLIAVKPKLPCGEVQTLRFTCTSSGGVLITDVES